MKCRKGEREVKCDVQANVTEPRFEFFSIGKHEIDLNETQNVSNVKFLLYPRSLDNESWLNSTVFYSNSFRTYSFFYNQVSSSAADYGFRVKDFNCFEKLVASIGSSKLDQIITLNVNDFYKVKADQIRVVGDLFIE